MKSLTVLIQQNNKNEEDTICILQSNKGVEMKKNLVGNISVSLSLNIKPQHARPFNAIGRLKDFIQRG